MERDLKFSIIVPTFNRPELLFRSLGRIVEQDHSNFEVIVVNDGGAESSEEVVKGFASETVRYYWKPNEQKGIAKNFGFSKASGDYVLSFDDDDVMYPRFLATAEKQIRDHDFPDLYYQGYEIIDENENCVSHPKPIDPAKLDLFKGNPFSNNGMFIKRSIAELPLYLHRKDFTLSADWLLWIKLFSKFKCVINNDVTHGVTVHPQRGSASANVAQYEKNLEIFETELRENDWGTDAQINRAIAHYRTYVALFLMISGRKSKALKHLLSGVALNPAELFTRRFLAISKYLLKNSPG